MSSELKWYEQGVYDEAIDGYRKFAGYVFGLDHLRLRIECAEPRLIGAKTLAARILDSKPAYVPSDSSFHEHKSST